MITQFTPTERRIFQLLADGKPHTYAEIKGVLGDLFMENGAIRAHIKNMRRKLMDEGQGILFESWEKTSSYRLVRRIASSYR